MNKQALQIAKAAGSIEKDGYFHVLQGDYNIERFYELVREDLAKELLPLAEAAFPQARNETLDESANIVRSMINDTQSAKVRLVLMLAAKQLELRKGQQP